MDGRILNFLTQLESQCADRGADEFEFSMEMWSAFGWMACSVYINGESVDVSKFNGLSGFIDTNDFDYLVEVGKLELLKEYSYGELNRHAFEIERKQYRLKESV